MWQTSSNPTTHAYLDSVTDPVIILVELLITRIVCFNEPGYPFDRQCFTQLWSPYDTSAGVLLMSPCPRMSGCFWTITRHGYQVVLISLAPQVGIYLLTFRLPGEKCTSIFLMSLNPKMIKHTMSQIKLSGKAVESCNYSKLLCSCLSPSLETWHYLQLITSQYLLLKSF